MGTILLGSSSFENNGSFRLSYLSDFPIFTRKASPLFPFLQSKTGRRMKIAAGK